MILGVMRALCLREARYRCGCGHLRGCGCCSERYPVDRGIEAVEDSHVEAVLRARAMDQHITRQPAKLRGCK
jgi:hypothetical protein